jgi:hypothetical protein
MLPLAVATVLALAAPPPKPADKTGRITLWIDDKIVSFLPDGSDVVNIPKPDIIKEQGFEELVCFTPTRKISHGLRSPTDFKSDKIDWKLVVKTFGAGGGQFILDGYVVRETFPSADGLRIYFVGFKGKEIDRSKDKYLALFVLDLETKKVSPLPIPERHELRSISSDGKHIITVRYDVGESSASLRPCLIVAGEKPVEILKENMTINTPSFSQDGSKVLIQAFLRSVERDVAGDVIIKPSPTSLDLHVVLDVETRTTKPFKRPRGGMTYQWSPDGTQIATLSRGRIGDDAQPANRRGGVQLGGYEYRVYVSDTEGTNPKLVYKVDAGQGLNFNGFLWR